MSQEHPQAENNLKDYALSYVKAYKDRVAHDEDYMFENQKRQGIEIDDPGIPVRSDTDRADIQTQDAQLLQLCVVPLQRASTHI